MSSAASQPPAHASSHQSPSAFTEGQLVANLPEGTQDMIRAAELSRLLAHCTVLSPYELLSVAFPKTHEWDIKPNDDIKFSFSTKLVSFPFYNARAICVDEGSPGTFQSQIHGNSGALRSIGNYFQTFYPNFSYFPTEGCLHYVH